MVNPTVIIKGAEIALGLLKDPTVRRYGSALIKKVGGEKGEKIIGSLESVKLPSNLSVISNKFSLDETDRALVDDKIQKVVSVVNKGSKIAGGMASLGWTNLAVSGVNMGITQSGIAVAQKKVETLSGEVVKMNSNFDDIMRELTEIRRTTKGLEEHAIRTEYEKAANYIKDINSYAKAFAVDEYDSRLRRDAEQLLNHTSTFIEKNAKGYMNPDSTIVISLDEILAMFYAYTSLLKSYVSAVQLNDRRLESYESHQECMKTLCSGSMISSIQEIYSKNSSTYMTPQDLASITAIYKNIMTEQISEVKSQKMILESMSYDDYKKATEDVHNANETGNDDLLLLEFNE